MTKYALGALLILGATLVPLSSASAHGYGYRSWYGYGPGYSSYYRPYYGGYYRGYGYANYGYGGYGCYRGCGCW